MHMGLSNYTARFAKFDATIEFDPANPTASKVTATIDPTSVRTDYPGNYKATHKGSPFKTWDEDLAKNDKWFNAGKFPAITFTSTGVELTGATTGKVTGDLEMLGVKKPVTLDVTFNGSKNPHPFIPTAALGFSASGTIKRSEFGMTNLIGGIGDDVQIFIEAEFIQAPPGGAAAKK
jgi:polyisoprenoid-binding protein YceI